MPIPPRVQHAVDATNRLAEMEKTLHNMQVTLTDFEKKILEQKIAALRAQLQAA